MLARERIKPHIITSIDTEKSMWKTMVLWQKKKTQLSEHEISKVSQQNQTSQSKPTANIILKDSKKLNTLLVRLIKNESARSATSDHCEAEVLHWAHRQEKEENTQTGYEEVKLQSFADGMMWYRENSYAPIEPLLNQWIQHICRIHNQCIKSVAHLCIQIMNYWKRDKITYI